MRGAVPDGEQVVVTRDVTVPGQVIGVLKVTGTPTASVLDYADSGLWGRKEKWVGVTSSSPKTPDLCGSLPSSGHPPLWLSSPNQQTNAQAFPLPVHPCAMPSPGSPGQGKTTNPALCHPLLTNFIDVFIGC